MYDEEIASGWGSAAKGTVNFLDDETTSKLRHFTGTALHASLDRPTPSRDR